MPSVRGPQRAAVITTMIASGIASAALVGFAVGVIGQLVPTPSVAVLAMGVMVAVALDFAGTKVSWLRAPSIGKQVPIEWGRMFTPSVVAFLYGARLGVGPLTILSTWLWWAATFGAAATSVGVSVIVGVVFGAVRLSSTALASLQAERVGHTTWFIKLRTLKSRAWVALDATAAALSVLVLANSV